MEEGERMGEGEAILTKIQECFEGKRTSLTLFGKERDIDFSQMKPRGHYAKTEELKRYFRGMMWLGRIDMKIAGVSRRRR